MGRDLNLVFKYTTIGNHPEHVDPDEEYILLSRTLGSSLEAVQTSPSLFSYMD